MPKLFNFILTFILLVGFSFVSGCTLIGEDQAPVLDGWGLSSGPSSQKHSIRKKNASPSRHPKQAGDYLVKRGDTLYSIAWAHNMDFRTLAEINQLESPYRIYAGQYLKTRPGFLASLRLAFSSPKKQNKQASPVRRGQSSPSALAVRKSTSSKSPRLTQKTTTSAHVRVASQKKNKASQITSAKKTLPRKPVVLAGDRNVRSLKGWRWPARGQIIQGFSPKAGGNKGVDIAGSYGAPVRAASSGKVVYSGSGLKGYGQLLLIKHSNTFLSAYAHNKRLLVKEGDEVKIGQQIAEIGRVNQGQSLLHFEIRRNGQPVDPMIYLAGK